VHLPTIFTAEVDITASEVGNATRLTPAFRVGFSVYVPSRMNIVSPDVAAVIAAVIVVCVPWPAVAETIHFTGPYAALGVMVYVILSY